MIKFDFNPDIICPDDRTASNKRILEYMDYYPIKSMIAYLCQPQKIAEIGVRCGYSAWAFLQACPAATYAGFDAENGTHGGKGGETGKYGEWAKKLIGDRGTYAVLDTQTVDILPGAPYDFVHVDGDHTTKGTIHDVDVALRSVNIGGYVLVDDYDFIPEVREGVNSFFGFCQDLIDAIYFKSLRGEYLFRKVCIESDMEAGLI